MSVVSPFFTYHQCGVGSRPAL